MACLAACDEKDALQRYAGYVLDSLKGIILGTTIGAIRDTLRLLAHVAPAEKSGCKGSGLRVQRFGSHAITDFERGFRLKLSATVGTRVAPWAARQQPKYCNTLNVARPSWLCHVFFWTTSSNTV